MTPRESDIHQLQKHLNVSRETIQRLKTLESEIVRWNQAINLVSAASMTNIWTRHFLDSAQIWRLRPKTAQTWLDLGSGAGLPGLVVAILAKDECPEMHVTLVESDARKAAFLINTGHLLDLSVSVKINRAETLDPQAADVISARALASLEILLGYSDRHSKKTTVLLLHKGEKAEMELTKARKHWTFTLSKTPSVTDPSGLLLQIGGLRRVEP